MSEQLYTLDEARTEIARIECEQHGHVWQVDVQQPDDPAPGTPAAVWCIRCSQRHAVAAAD